MKRPDARARYEHKSIKTSHNNNKHQSLRRARRSEKSLLVAAKGRTQRVVVADVGGRLSFRVFRPGVGAVF